MAEVIEQTTAPQEQVTTVTVPPVEQPKEPTAEEIFKKVSFRQDKASKPLETPKTAPEPQKTAPEPLKASDGSKEQKSTEKAPEPKEQQKHEGSKPNERIQQLSRESKEWEAKARRAEAELSELRKLQEMKTEDKTPKDFAREVVLEQQAAARQEEIKSNLYSYIESHPDAEQFVSNYDFYVPFFSEKDPETLQIITKHPNSIEMLDLFMNAFTSGQATLEKWTSLPRPAKEQAIRLLRRDLENAKKGVQPNAQTQTQPQKQVPDSVRPLVSNAGSNPDDENDVNAIFRRTVMRKRWD